VARFHLANGARLARLNWGGDASATGIAVSLGITANYIYRIADVEENHEAYAKDFKVVTSSTLERLARDVGGRDDEPSDSAKASSDRQRLRDTEKI
jgi:malonyl-CoA decarboxylase